MSEHPEPSVRSELMDHVPHIAMLCHANKSTLLYAVDHLLALVAKLLTDEDNKVRKSAQVTLLVLMNQELLQQSAVEDVICPVVIQQPTLEDYPGSGVQFMSKMAPFLGPESTERLFLKRFCELCQDTVGTVRKRCVLNFGEFCAVVGQRTTEEVLLPKFIDLCQDEAWTIRKTCADVLPSVSYICSIECRRAILAPVFVRLLQDCARPVRTAAFRTLGPFISTFAVPSIADLSYDENGELVFTHPKGTEFRFHTGQDRVAFERQMSTLSIRTQEKPLERFYENLEKQMNNLPIGISMSIAQDEDPQNSEESPLDTSQDLNQSVITESDQNANDEGPLSRFFNSLKQTNTSPSEVPMSIAEEQDTPNSDESPIGSSQDLNQSVENERDQIANDKPIDRFFNSLKPTSTSPSEVPMSITEDQQTANNGENLEDTSQDIDLSSVNECDDNVNDEIPLSKYLQNQANILYAGMSITEDLKDSQESEVLSLNNLPQASDSESIVIDSATSNETLVKSCDFNEHISNSLPVKEFNNNGTDLETDCNKSQSHLGSRLPLNDLQVDFIRDALGLNDTPCNNSSSSCTEDHEKQETDLDDGSARNKALNQEVPCSETSSEEWDFNSFQFWRVPIPDVDLHSTENFRKVNLESFKDKLTHLCSTLAFPKSEQHSCHHLPCDNRNYEVSAMQIYSTLLPPCTPPQDIVPQELVEHFISMTAPAHYNSEIAQHCAFSFPAVALTLGRKHWGFLRGTYEALANDMQWAVRRAVASSIHVLAEILGEELASQDLVPIFSGLIKDLDEVRIGALRHLGEFLKLLPSSERETFLPKFGEFLVTDNESNWRFREELVQQLLKVLSLFSPEDACNHLKPIAICLLRDKVAAVRNASLLLVTQLIQHVQADSSLLRQLLPQLAEEFAHSLKWERRQTFALLCSHLVSPQVLPGEQFAREVMPHLLDLSYDPVPNVRLAVARTLASDLMSHHFFNGEPHLEVLMQVLRRLSNDNDRDVRYFASPRFL